MKLFPCVFLCCLGLCSLLLAWCLPTVAQERPAVVSVSFHTEDAQKERVRIKLEGTHAPKVYPINGEKPRLVVDFPGAGYAGLVTPLLKDDDTLVKNIRVGVHKKPAAMVRVVLDLQPGWKYTYSRDFVKEENILNIVLAPAARIKKTESPIARIDADEAKRMVVNETKKSVPSDAVQPPPPSPAEKPVLDVAASAAPVKTAAKPVKAETVASVPPPAPHEVDKTVKKTEVAPASVAIPRPEETAAKVEPAVNARPPVAEPQAQKPAAPAETPKNVAALPPSAEKPEKKTAEAGQKSGAPAPAPADQSRETPAASPAQAEIVLQADPLLLDITYENSSSKGEMVFFRLNGFFPPSVSAVESDNPQVVCEFANTAEKGNIKPVIETNGAYVQKISTNSGKDPKKIQVTLQLTPGRDYDLRQVFFKEDNLFVLVVNTMDEENVGSAPADEKK